MLTLGLAVDLDVKEDLPLRGGRWRGAIRRRLRQKRMRAARRNADTAQRGARRAARGACASARSAGGSQRPTRILPFDVERTLWVISAFFLSLADTTAAHAASTSTVIASVLILLRFATQGLL